MPKISDHLRSVVHDHYILYVKRDDGNYEEILRDSDYSHIELVIDELECLTYFIERITISQYVPKDRRFKLDGK